MRARDRRALVLGGATIGLAWLALRAVPAAHGAITRWEAGLRARREWLARSEAALAELPALEESTAVLTRRLAELAPRILAGSSENEAAASLAGLLGNLAMVHRARLERVERVADSMAAGPLRRVTMDAVVETDVRGLAALVSALASQQPVTHLVRLRVSTQDPGGHSSQPEVLRIELRVQGWFLGVEAS
jgi:hypothetical protein